MRFSWHEDNTLNKRIIEVNKSLIVSHLRSGDVFVNRWNLSSKMNLGYIKNEIKEEEKNANQFSKIDTNFECAFFEYKSESSGLIMTHRINLLLTIDEQDLISWKIGFMGISIICRWSEEVQLEVLTQIDDSNIQHQIGRSTSAEEMLYKIMSLRYKPNTAYKYQARLSSIRQTNFYTIRAYLKELKITVHVLGFCNGWSNDNIQAKNEECFFAGLDDIVKFKKNLVRTFRLSIHLRRLITDGKFYNRKNQPHTNHTNPVLQRRTSKTPYQSEQKIHTKERTTFE
ncbi:hypothetical protein DMUE_1582 [Dictyocoela muelleri]|nr:hypothetical protein DMUE_1582 [Dictyocoela muelleri]